MSTYSLPFRRKIEERFHAPLDYAEASSRRKTVYLVLSWLLIAGLFWRYDRLASQPKAAYFAVQMPNGETYIISDSKKKIDLRSDVLGYQAVKMSLNSFAEAYFERSAVTARKDYEHARWFLPDSLLAAYDDAANGPKGWVAQLTGHLIPESHALVDSVEMRESDLLQEPYQARVYLTRTNLASGEVTHTISTLTFVVRPDIWLNAKAGVTKFGRFPLYNALGVIIAKPPEETPDWRK